MNFTFDPREEARLQADWDNSPLAIYARTGIITPEAIEEATRERDRVAIDNPDSMDCDELHMLVDYLTSHA